MDRDERDSEHDIFSEHNVFDQQEFVNGQKIISQQDFMPIPLASRSAQGMFAQDAEREKNLKLGVMIGLGIQDLLLAIDVDALAKGTNALAKDTSPLKGDV